MKAKLVRQVKSAMQSGDAKACGWLMVFDDPEAFASYNIMNWMGATSTAYQVCLPFDTLEMARQFAEGHHIDLEIESLLPQKAPKPKSYAANFTRSPKVWKRSF